MKICTHKYISIVTRTMRKQCLVVKNYREGPLDLEWKGNAVSGETPFKPGDEGLESNQGKIWRK